MKNKNLLRYFCLKKFEGKSLKNHEIENILGVNINDNLNLVIQKYKFLYNSNILKNTFYNSEEYNNELQYLALKNIINHKIENFQKINKNEKIILNLIKLEGINKILPLENLENRFKMDNYDKILEHSELQYLNFTNFNSLLFLVLIFEILIYCNLNYYN